MRCAVARVCARAAGLTATMGMFLAQPLLEHLQVSVAPHMLGVQGALVVRSVSLPENMPSHALPPPPPHTHMSQSIIKGQGLMSDARGVMELLVPLSARPAMKAGLLELKALSTLARFLYKLISQ